MPTPHKHAEIIKAWADGHQIQVQCPNEKWFDLKVKAPSWDPDIYYRIKPTPITITGFAYCIDHLQGSWAFEQTQTSIQRKPATLTFYPDE